MTDIEVGRLREIADTINRRDVEQMAEISRLRSLVKALIAANAEKDEALRVLIEDRATPKRNGGWNDWYIPPVTSAN